jgi:hypothetical protein
MESKEESGETTLVPLYYDQDDYQIYGGLFEILNRLDIPFKGCWTTIRRSRRSATVYYIHTDMNF